MNNQEITENNKLIAEFMGYKQDANGKYEIIEDFDIVENIQTYVEDDDYRTVEGGIVLVNFLPKEMRFDISWDWLMPVVRKIMEYQWENENSELALIVRDALCDVSIRGTYDAVIEFIKYHKEENDDSVSNEGQ